MRKKALALVLSLALTSSLCVPASATFNEPNSNNNSDFTIGDNYKDYDTETTSNQVADKPHDSQTGEGTATEDINVETRTQEQKEDDATKREQEDLMKKIEELIEGIKNGGGGGGTKPNPDIGIDTDYDNIDKLPEIDPTIPGGSENPDYSIPYPTLPGTTWDKDPGILGELEINVDYVPPEKWVEVPGSTQKNPSLDPTPTKDEQFVVDSFQMPLSTLLALATTYKRNNAAPIVLPSNAETRVTANGDISSYTMDYYRPGIWKVLINYIQGTLPNPSLEVPPIDVPDDGYVDLPDIDDLLPLPDLDDFEEEFEEVVDTKPLPDTGFEINVPKGTDDMYRLLIEYIRRLNELGQTTVTITRITQYQFKEYAIRTIKSATPLNEYTWVVTAQDGTTYRRSTDNRFLSFIFKTAGTYAVQVYNKQNVIRNNRISGAKNTYWILGNGDMYDGLLIYQSGTTFSAFVGEDIGPRLEEIELLRDGFTARVTPAMINDVQMIDTKGNIRSPSSGYSTERH